MRWSDLEPGDVYTTATWSYLVLTKPKPVEKSLDSYYRLLWDVLILDTGRRLKATAMHSETVIEGDVEVMARERAL